MMRRARVVETLARYGDKTASQLLSKRDDELEGMFDRLKRRLVVPDSRTDLKPVKLDDD